MTKAQIIVIDAFKAFKRKIIEIEYLQSVTKKVFIKSLREINKQNNIESTRTDSNYRSSHTQSFWIRNIHLGHRVHCEVNEFNLEEQMQLLLELFNKQYQMLLVDAYEAFEKYLKVAQDELEKVDSSSSSKKSFSALRILKKLHAKIPQIDLILETRNQQDSWYPNKNQALFFVCLIEKLRHCIVHNHGFVADKTKLADDCMNDIGAFENGNYPRYYVDILNCYFGNGLNSNRICLLEIHEKSRLQLTDKYTERLGELISVLISYTQFIDVFIQDKLK